MSRPRPLYPWRQAAPYEPDPWWYTALEVIGDTAILLTLIIGIPFLLWLVAS